MAEPSSLKEIMAYFGLTASQFMKEWKLFTEQDKADFKAAFTNGSFTY